MNTGGGPDVAIVFDSANPTGGDVDLGTPNEDFGGPGMGVGGESGAAGENSVALGNLLIVAEDDIDANGDGLVDDPDDEAGGGIIKLDFDGPTDVLSLQIVDIEESNQGFVLAYDGANQVIANVPMQMLGDNSVQRLDINAVGVRRLEVVFPGSGAVSDIDLCLPDLPSIDIRKQIEGPDTRVVAPGVDVDFEIKVTNTGDVTLFDVVVSDPLTPDCDRVIGQLAPGEMVTYTCTAPAASIGGGGGGTRTYKDTFTTHEYDNDDGDADWAGPWIEEDIGASQSPHDGNIIIGSNDKLWLDDNPDSESTIPDGPSIKRSVDLSGTISATLSFDFLTHSGVDTDDAVVVEVSSDGVNFDVLEEFTGVQGSSSGARSYDISAYISATTTVRFRVSSMHGGDNETFKIDDVMIVAEEGNGLVNEACVSGNDGILEVDDCDTSTVVVDSPCEDIVIEAETVPYFGNFQIKYDSNAMGGAALKVTPGSGDYYDTIPTGDRAEFSFSVPQAGTYRFIGHVYAADDSSDSFWVKVDGQPADGFLWDFLGNTEYLPDFINDRGGMDPVEVYLEAGPHTLVLYQREDGARIDKLTIVCGGGQATPTPTPAATATPPTAHSTPTPTPTKTKTPQSSTPTQVPSATPTRTQIPTNTPSVAPSQTPTPTPVPNVEVDIRKDDEGPNTRVVDPNNPVVFEISVHNPSMVDLTNVMVSDPLLSDCDRNIGVLAAGQTVTYFCTLPAGSLSTGGGTMTYEDTFSTMSYSRNDGTANWTGPWIENDVADGNQSPTAGNVLIGSNFKLWFDDYPDTGTDPSAKRSADLSGKTSATLAFDFQTHSGVDADDAVVAEVSSDGSNFVILETFTGIVGAVTGSRSYDISAYISSTTTIRFRVSNLYGGSNETFKVDNVVVTGDGALVSFENEACVSGQGAGATVEDCDTSTIEPMGLPME